MVIVSALIQSPPSKPPPPLLLMGIYLPHIIHTRSPGEPPPTAKHILEDSSLPSYCLLFISRMHCHLPNPRLSPLSRSYKQRDSITSHPPPPFAPPYSLKLSCSSLPQKKKHYKRLCSRNYCLYHEPSPAKRSPGQSEA